MESKEHQPAEPEIITQGRTERSRFVGFVALITLSTLEEWGPVLDALESARMTFFPRTNDGEPENYIVIEDQRYYGNEAILSRIAEYRTEHPLR